MQCTKRKHNNIAATQLRRDLLVVVVPLERRRLRHRVRVVVRPQRELRGAQFRRHVDQRHKGVVELVDAVRVVELRLGARGRDDDARGNHLPRFRARGRRDHGHRHPRRGRRQPSPPRIIVDAVDAHVVAPVRTLHQIRLGDVVAAAQAPRQQVDRCRGVAVAHTRRRAVEAPQYAHALVSQNRRGLGDLAIRRRRRDRYGATGGGRRREAVRRVERVGGAAALLPRGVACYMTKGAGERARQAVARAFQRRCPP
mmetsp:Transcript_5155/g.16021  ORF Transcript_5155/g.16021 Transcript_5155/m.16021 type:complete len:255 (+) Transcript_5155:120-884(+)